ncbi:hypothetical protein [Hymenobacter pini]|uniref:hypothetical protein n=1 Tax=Hymenobacter pini TaxID=2880879 RepID=UPI001CF30F16|nr:hypothetical protein [Hymenobacter pini]MCA8832375.1 hypothetical protein [Hymenobacter pini]
MVYPILSYELVFEAAHGVGSIYLVLGDQQRSRVPLQGLPAAAFNGIVTVLASGGAGYDPQARLIKSRPINA